MRSMYSTVQYFWPCSCSLWVCPSWVYPYWDIPIHKHSWALIEQRLPPSHDPTASRVSPSLMLVLVLLLVLMLMLNSC
jgi:hypothetical protein